MVTDGPPGNGNIDQTSSPGKGVADLQLEVAGLETESMQLQTGQSERAAELMSTIAGLLRSNKVLDPTLRAKLIEARKHLRANFPPSIKTPEKPKQQIDARLYDDSVMPAGEREKFLASLELLPDEYKESFIARLKSPLGIREPAKRVTSLRGLVFEMSRISTAIQQGLEQLDFSQRAHEPISVGFLGYPKEQTKFREGEEIIYPTHEFKASPIDSDIPIIRDGKQFIYEAKSFSRNKYGFDAGARNQLIKYQTAVEQGLVAGATVEVRGRIDHEFLDWAIGEKVGDKGNVPNVEIIYTLPLPSGKEYRFPLKRVKKNGLQFVNAETYSEEDLEVIRGLQKSLADKSIIRIITGVNIKPEEASEQLRPFIEDPTKIESIEDLEEYDRLRNGNIHKLFREKNIIVNKENKISAISEFATPEFIERLVVEYQDYLRKNPEIAKAKGAYMITDEQIPLALQKTLRAVNRVRDAEVARRDSPEEQQRQRRRTALGWAGKPEGVALDIEHIMIDTIYGINKEGFEPAVLEKSVGKANVGHFFQPHESGRLVMKFRSEAELQKAIETDEGLQKVIAGMTKGQINAVSRHIKESEFARSYEWTERFKKAEQIPALLQGQDRRYMELQIFDPKSESTTRQTDTNEDAIEKAKALILRENIQRAREHIANTPRESSHRREIQKLEKDISDMDQKKNSTLEEYQLSIKQPVADLSRQVGELQKQKKLLQKQGETNFTAIDQQINTLDQQRKDMFAELQRVSFEYQALMHAKYVELEGVYKKIIPVLEWEKFAKRVVKTIDQNIVKFIYTVTSAEEVMVQEEVIRGDVSGRAAHSELAQGGNIYGAGEIAFTKEGDKWILTEVNNGSGHYRPDASSTLFYVKNLLQKKGIDISRVELVDSILRGVALRNKSAF